MTAGLYSSNFVGCIAEIGLNDQKLDIMTNAIDGRNIRPCESWRRQARRRRIKSKKKAK